MGLKILFTSIFTLALLCECFAQKLDTEKLDRLFNKLAENNNAMLSTAVAKNGTILYSNSIGYSRINGTDTVLSNEKSRYRIGSISKMFTAVMIFQLIEEEKLSLSDKLDEFFPQIPNADNITIKHLLGHQSGLFDITDEPGFREWKVDMKMEKELLNIIIKNSPVFEPGAETQYSNSNFILLGRIVSSLTGTSYQNALEKRITSKLDLKDTYLGTGFVDSSKNEVSSFFYTGKWQPEPETHLSLPGGAGSLISTPADLTKFITALFELVLVSQESLDKMTDIEEKYGLGIVKYVKDDKTLYGYGGGIDGFNALTVYLPEEKLAIAFTSNGRNFQGINILGAIWDIYWNKPFELPTFESISIKTEILDKYVGIYSSPEVPVKFIVTRENSVLRLNGGEGPVIPLEAETEKKFKIARRGIIIEFIPEKEQMILTREGKETIFTKEN
jgi:D-alanyl-D-alanine carboxypeptidase